MNNEAIKDSEIPWLQGEAPDIRRNPCHEGLLQHFRLLPRNISSVYTRQRLLMASAGENGCPDFIDTCVVLTRRLKMTAAHIRVTPECCWEIRRKSSGN